MCRKQYEVFASTLEGDSVRKEPPRQVLIIVLDNERGC